MRAGNVGPSALEKLNYISVRQARDELAKLPEAPRFTWAFRQRNFMEKLIEEDGVDNFLHWPISREAIYAGYTSIYTAPERAVLPESYRHICVDYPYPVSPGPLSPEGASGTYIKQMLLSYLAERDFLSGHGWRSIRSVYEIGGGYGAMAVVLRRLGFSGKHEVLDFEAMHIIRRWYLAHAGIRTHSNTGVYIGDGADVLIASHSLCEMPVADRINILDNVKADYYIFSITNRFDGIDNKKWFYDWCISEGLLFEDLYSYVHNLSDNQTIIIAARTQR